MFADTYNVQGHNKPNLVYRNFDKVRAYDDITIHIPSHYRSTVLSNVKFYDDNIPVQKPIVQLYPTNVNITPSKAFQDYIDKKQKISNKDNHLVHSTIELNMAIEDKPPENENIISKIISSTKKSLSAKKEQHIESMSHHNNMASLNRDDSGLNSIMKYKFNKKNSSIRPMLELEHYDP